MKHRSSRTFGTFGYKSTFCTRDPRFFASLRITETTGPLDSCFRRNDETTDILDCFVPRNDETTETRDSGTSQEGQKSQILWTTSFVEMTIISILMLNQRFIDYFRENFFQDKPEELAEFLASIELSIPRTIRIKPGMVDEVRNRLEKDGWILSNTSIANVFSLDRREDFNPLERRIGFSLDHLLGNFYIQELAAAQPVDILADNKIQEDDFLILDLASSPGGKTTQLAEYFPNSFIIANEPTRERIPQLLQNLERMYTPNVAITLYPGQYWKNFSETFDRVLLDAPCSGEGTLYKGTDAVKHWHLKNIKQISRLQERLIDAALHTLKIGGEMIYSTCALNLLENEGVVNAMMAKYPGAFEVLFQKRFWPHIDGTGGFFVTKLRKIAALGRKKSEIENSWKAEKRSSFKISNTALARFHGRLGEWKEKEGITLYEHEGKILAVANGNISEFLREKIFPMRYGEYIGNIVNGKYEPSIWAFRSLDIGNIEKYVLQNEQELDKYLRGNPIESIGEDCYILIQYDQINIGLERRRGHIISNQFPKDWQRK